MMEEVVELGHRHRAPPSTGYTVAGKTGTAQIPDPSHLGYIPGAYVGTFAGFAPAENPVLSAIVVLDHPTPIYGGTVAAPVFSPIMAYALHRYGIPTTPAAHHLGLELGRRRHRSHRRAGRSDPEDRRWIRIVVPHGTAPAGRARRTSPRADDRLIHDVDVIGRARRPAVHRGPAVDFDSRRVGPGRCSAAFPATHTDGHRHAAEAVAGGAVALCASASLDLDVTQVRVAAGQVRPAMAQVAATFFGHPSRALTMVGVTGTNGKTTVTHLVAVDPRASRARPPGSSARSTGPAPPRRPRSPGPAGRACARRRGRRARGHGGVLPRAGPAPGRRHRLRRGRLHQPEPRPPRPPRHHGGVLRRQGLAVRPRSEPGWRWSTWTTPGAAALAERPGSAAWWSGAPVGRHRHRPRLGPSSFTLAGSAG